MVQDIFDHVRERCDHDQIFQVCLWTPTEKPSGITSIMLSTLNIGLMEQIRNKIRLYDKHRGFRLETYSKSQFVKKYGISMYIPKESA